MRVTGTYLIQETLDLLLPPGLLVLERIGFSAVEVRLSRSGYENAG